MTEKKTLPGPISEVVTNNFNQSIPQQSQFLKIPKNMRERPQWVNWGLQSRDNQTKPSKVPYQLNGQLAKINDSSTWTTFDKTHMAYLGSNGKFKGVGYVFAEDDPFVGVDIDDCIDDNGNISDEARAIIDEFYCYTEYSQSGKGIHIIAEASIPGEKRRAGNIEIYDSSRYFAMTGNKIPGSPGNSAPRQTEINNLYARLFNNEKIESPKTIGDSIDDLSDDEVIRKALNARNSDRFNSLFFEGDISANAYDDSAADLALCNILAYYTKDANQIDRLFRKSKLFRQKWEREDYRKSTIGKALTDTKSAIAQATVVQEPVIKKNRGAIEMPIPKSGFLHEYVKWASQGTDAPDEFLLMSGLMAASTALIKNGNYWLQFGALPIYPIVWSLILAGSSTFRKSTALSYARRTLENAVPDSIFADRVTPESFYQLLELQPSGLFTISEFGAFLKQFEKSYCSGLKEDLTELFDCPSEFKRQKKGRNDTLKVYSAKNPRINLFGASTLEWFIDRITEADAASGFLARFVYVNVTERTKNKMRVPTAINIGDPAIMDWLKHLSTVQGKVIFNQTSPGFQEYDAFCTMIENDVIATGLSLNVIEAFSERLKIYVLKFAMICEAVSSKSNTQITSISIDAMIEACNLGEWFWSNIKSLLMKDITFSQFTRKQKKLEELLRQHGGKATRRDLLRLLHCDVKELNQITDTLIASEIIRSTAVSKGNGSTSVVYELLDL